MDERIEQLKPLLRLNPDRLRPPGDERLNGIVEIHEAIAGKIDAVDNKFLLVRPPERVADPVVDRSGLGLGLAEYRHRISRILRVFELGQS